MPSSPDLAPSAPEDPLIVCFDLFEQAINAEMSAFPRVGYTYALFNGMQPVRYNGVGFAELTPPFHQNPNQPQNVASITKTITVAGLLVALKKVGGSFTDPIGKYLPEWWKASPEVQAVRFQDLVNGTSGLGGGSSLPFYSKVKEMVTPVKLTPGVYHYPNGPIGLCRVLIPRILMTLPPWSGDPWVQWALSEEGELGWTGKHPSLESALPGGQAALSAQWKYFYMWNRKADPSAPPVPYAHLSTGNTNVDVDLTPELNPADTSVKNQLATVKAEVDRSPASLCTAAVFTSFIKEYVTSPCDGNKITVGDADPFRRSPTPTRYYQADPPASAPLVDNFSSNDPTVNISQLLVCGAGWYVMSALEVGQLIASISVGGKVIGSSGWAEMFEAGLGGPVFEYAYSGKAGTYAPPPYESPYWYKNGIWSGTHKVPGYLTGWMTFPGGVTGVLLVNSRSASEHEPAPTVLERAYAASVVKRSQCPSWFDAKPAPQSDWMP